MTEAGKIVLTDAPRRPTDDSCPRCGAGKQRRVKSSGFGEKHDVCRDCGFEEFDG